MKEYLVCKIWDYNTKVTLRHARRMTEEEKKPYTEEARDKMFVGLGYSVELECLMAKDVMSMFSGRQNDGTFPGTGSWRCFIITEEEWNQLIRMNEKKRLDNKKKHAAEDIETCKRIIADCEKQKKLYTKEEAKKKTQEWVVLYNEGKEGLVPHFYTEGEYENAKRKLEELKKILEEREEERKTFRTIILRKGTARLPKQKHQLFCAGNTIWGADSEAEEIRRWPAGHEQEALEELKKYKCRKDSNGQILDIEEYALEYCECNAEGELVRVLDYRLADKV